MANKNSLENDTSSPPSWDLSRIIPEPSEEKLNGIRKDIDSKIDDLSTKFQSLLLEESISAQEILFYLESWEKLLDEVVSFIAYGDMAFSTNSILSLNQIARQQASECRLKAHQGFLPFQLKINSAIIRDPSLLEDPILSRYQNFLKKEAEDHKHKLDLEIESIILEKDQTGIKALLELHSSYVSKIQISLDKEGKTISIPLGQAEGLLHETDPQIRTSVLEGIEKEIEPNGELYATTLRSTITDWVKSYKHRKYSSAIEHSLDTNDVEWAPVSNLMKTMEKRVSYYQKYLFLKAKQLGFSTLKASDQLAPPNLPSYQTYSWEQTQEIIVGAYYACDKELGDIVQTMFDEKRIDAEIRNGKFNSAFCRPLYTDKSAFVLMNFTGKLIDLFTLAHELGHALHAYLEAKNFGFLLSNKSDIFAESAAKFGEVILTDYLLRNAKSKEEKIQILTQVLDFNGYSMYWGTIRYFFEMTLHKAIEQGEFLNSKRICELYLQNLKKVYGDTIGNQEKVKWEWVYTPHYYTTETRFYNYSYIFALNFAYKIKQLMEINREVTIKKFKHLLEAGMSSMESKGKELGIDFHDPNCWEESLLEYKKYIDEYEKLINS
ncbi:MAG: M3 family oligoendopeptidase [Candidatus Thorarchaeota archaeon]